MNWKSLIPLIAGLCVGGFALKVGLDTLQKAKGSQNTATTQVWTAKMDVPRGTRITEEMIQPLDFPTKLVPPKALTDKEQLLGRVAHIDAPAGLPILDGMLLPLGQTTGVHVPAGYRAVAVKIDEGSGVDFHLEPGSRVDVVGYFVSQNSGGKRENVARTLIENVEVAAVGARISAVAAEGGKSSRPTRAVTLLVKPDKVPILHLAEQRGKIKLSMRSDEDNEEFGRSALVSEEELLGQIVTGEDGQSTPDDDQPGAAEAGLAALLRGMFAKSEPAAKPPAVVPPGVAAPVAPEPQADPPWVVYVYHGVKQEIVRFAGPDSRQRVTEQSTRNPKAPASPAGPAPGLPNPTESRDGGVAAAAAEKVMEDPEEQLEE